MRCLFLCALLFAFPVYAQKLPGESPEKLQDLMDDWISLESQTGSLQMAWRERKESLTRRSKLFDEEKLALRKVIDSASNVTDDVNQRRLELLTEQQRLEAEQLKVDQVIAQAVPKLHQLRDRLPPPVQEEWAEKLAMLSQSDTSNSEKLERIFNLLNAAEEFNERVAMHESSMEIVQAGTSKQVLVTQIYLGVAQGWYVSNDGSAYGYGKSTPEGWRWWHGSNASAELGRQLHPSEILSLKAMLENPTTANYLSLPIKI